MADLLYGILLFALTPIYLVAPLFSKRAREFYRTRREGRCRLKEFFARPADDVPVFWLHGSSAGELDQARGVARELRRRGTVRIVITVFSLSVKRLPEEEADLACYLPLDLPFAWRFLSRSPDVFITFTWDVFPNLLRRLHRLGGRCYLASGALPENSWRLRYAKHLRSFYRNLDGIGTVDDANRERFLRLLPFENRVRTTGDTRYDTIFYRLECSSLTAEDEACLNACRPLLILASTYLACDRQLVPHLPAWMKAHPDLDVWVFPHHVNDARLRECEEGLSQAGLSCTRYSRLTQAQPSRVVLVDRLGLLARWYAKAKYCYVGGGFHHRIHNTAEPAALGSLVVTGPRIETSPIALQLEAEGTLFRRSTGKELLACLDDLERNEQRRFQLSERSRQLLLSQRGASARFLDAFNLFSRTRSG